MRRSVVRPLVALMMLASLTLVAFASPASAKGKPVTVTITCTSDASSYVNVSVQMRMGDPGGVDVGDPIATNCGPESQSGLMTNTISGVKLPDKADGFIVYWYYGPTTADPNGNLDPPFVVGSSRNTSVDLADSGPAVLATVSVN